jgi:hypothetical protein
MRRGLAAFLLLTPLVLSASVRADPKHDKEEEKGGPLRQASLFTGASKVSWRGSQLVLRNALSAISLDRSAEQTYNPYYAMTWSFRPWWWFGDKFFVRAQLDVIHELTEPDETTFEREALLDDLRLVAGGSGLWTIPFAGVHLSADLALILPTSKASRGRTLVLGLGPGLRLSRAFALFGYRSGGLIVGYNLRVTPYFHRYTTAERETPLIPGCSSGGCDVYLNTGKRNPVARLAQIVDVSVRILDWLGASLVLGHAVDWLHEIGAAPPEVTYQAVDDQGARYLTFFELTASFRPVDLLEIGVGYSALHPQLAPDSSYYVPFFNRYSVFFVDLKVHAEALVTRVRRFF